MLTWLPFLLWVILGIDVLVILPLILLRRTRMAGLLSLHFSNYVMGFILWLFGLVLCYKIWGLVAVIVGLLLGGVGVVPVAMLATFLTGNFGFLTTLIFFSLLIIGLNFFFIYLVAKISEDSNQSEGEERVSEKKWPIVVGVLLWVFGVIYLIGVVLGVETCTEIDENTRECTPTFFKELPSTIEKYNEEDHTVSVYDKETGELLETY